LRSARAISAAASLSAFAAFPAAAAFATGAFSVFLSLGAFTAVAFPALPAFAFLCDCLTRHQAKAGDGRHEFECESIHCRVG